MSVPVAVPNVLNFPFFKRFSVSVAVPNVLDFLFLERFSVRVIFRDADRVLVRGPRLYVVVV